MQIDLAVIGGSGYYQPEKLDDLQHKTVETKYGEATLLIGSFKGCTLAFLPRHGDKHQLPPHKINYRANIAALKALHVRRVISTTAVGSLREDIPRGTLVIIDQFIDQTKNREHTFYDGADEPLYHTDFTEPYCPQLRDILDLQLRKKGLQYVPAGTYICTEGPRYETPAEIRAYRGWGADVVGMTNVPEVTLAREADLCYATLSLVTNMAAGISRHPLTHREVMEVVDKKLSSIREIILEIVTELPAERNCSCWKKEDKPMSG